MIEFSQFRDLAKAYPELGQHLDYLFHGVLSASSVALNMNMGGNAFIVEVEADLRKLVGVLPGGNDTDNVIDSPYDISVDVHKRLNADWYMWSYITNDLGGDVYFYPHSLAQYVKHPL